VADKVKQVYNFFSVSFFRFKVSVSNSWGARVRTPCRGALAFRWWHVCNCDDSWVSATSTSWVGRCITQLSAWMHCTGINISCSAGGARREGDTYYYLID